MFSRQVKPDFLHGPDTFLVTRRLDGRSSVVRTKSIKDWKIGTCCFPC